MPTILSGSLLVSRRVRKTLNVDAEKLRRVKRYLRLETDTEVIDHLLDACDWERELAQILAESSPTWKTFRSPLGRPSRRT